MQSAPGPVQAEVTKFSRAILEGQRATTYLILKKQFEAHGPTHMYEDIIVPSLRAIGEMWAAGEIGVADEHLASATASAAAAALYPQFPWPQVRHGLVVLACPAGEQHGFGLRVAADLLALDGWDEVLLGIDLPLGELAHKLQELHPDVLALSVTRVAHLTSAGATVRWIREALPRVKILLGGLAVISDPARALECGADGLARSAQEGVELARRWR